MAVVETARAQIDEGVIPMPALEHALAALKLQGDFVPAALIAARIYANRGEARRAMSLLRRVWRAPPRIRMSQRCSPIPSPARRPSTG